MPLHLVKLCVGVASVAELEERIAFMVRMYASKGKNPAHIHTTRMIPKRSSELLDGGSLYWVMKGHITCRQSIADLRTFVDEAGVSRCDIVLSPHIIHVRNVPKRPFQGWRYLTAADAPTDVNYNPSDIQAMPESMRKELNSLGLL